MNNKHWEIEPGMIAIELNDGQVTVIDAEDLSLVAAFTWHTRKHRNTWYVKSLQRIKGTAERKMFRMHRMILDAPSGMEVDHIDGNGLNNRRSNLRLATRRQNAQNLHIKKSSRFPGVTWDKSMKLWRSQIWINKVTVQLGSYTEEEVAAEAYRSACLRL